MTRYDIHLEVRSGLFFKLKTRRLEQTIPVGRHFANKLEESTMRGSPAGGGNNIT